MRLHPFIAAALLAVAGCGDQTDGASSRPEAAAMETCLDHAGVKRVRDVAGLGPAAGAAEDERNNTAFFVTEESVVDVFEPAPVDDKVPGEDYRVYVARPAGTPEVEPDRALQKHREDVAVYILRTATVAKADRAEECFA